MARKIIVLSDGTGNSAAKLFKTNVWRTYQALDLSQSDQIAIYDDGVGTSSIKLLAILGGAFGWGLKRNVLHLYKYLCRNYRAGDDIYAFGFSRGAFTIRVLAGMVLSQGLVRWSSEEELELLAQAAYRDYRAQNYRRRASLSEIGRVIRDAWIVIRNKLYGLEPYTSSRNLQVDSIAFLGLWDTVDAYGLPIDELKAGIDRFIWPLYFDNAVLNPKVRQACHALALDDERATFHPLVWDESSEPEGSAQRRIHQVWFAGVHSNVGGGYPDDALSHVPLLWMLEHAANTHGANAPLRYKAAVMEEYRLAASPYGKKYDSRAGISSYYRYAPRRVDSYPAWATIHESVYQRIANGSDQYAPISIPARPSLDAQSELVWDTVWWRRVAYWLMVALTVALVFMGWATFRIPMLDDYARDLVGTLVDVAKAATPSMLAGWLDHLTRSPAFVVVLSASILATHYWGRFLEGRIRDRAAEIWRSGPSLDRQIWLKQSRRRWQVGTAALLIAALAALAAAFYLQADAAWKTIAAVAVLAAAGLFLVRRVFDAAREAKARAKPEAQAQAQAQADARAPVESPGWGLQFARAVRNSRGVLALWDFWSNSAIPFAFAMAVLFFGAHALNRISFAVLDLGGFVCKNSTAPERLALNQEKVVTFKTSMACFATGVQLERGAKYQIEFRSFSGWKDQGIEVTTLEGFSSNAEGAPWFMVFAAPMRRQMSEKWFRPVAHIGHHSLSERVLSRKAEISDTTRSGELFLFVNDAVVGLPFVWDHFYGNNQGEATVAIRKIEDAGQ